MNYGAVKQRVRDSIATIVNEHDTQVANWIEDALRDIHAETSWEWDRLKDTFTARGAIDGTATWTTGTSTITLSTGNVASQGIADEYIGGLLKLTSGNVYIIETWTQATGVITVSSPILEATAATPEQAQIIQDRITMEAGVESVDDIVDYLWPRRLDALEGVQHRLWPDPFLVLGARPYSWWVHGSDPAGNVQVILYPPPSETRVYLLSYWSRPRFPSADGDELEAVTGIPERFHPVIVAGAKWRAFEFEFEGDPITARARAEFRLGIDRMLAQSGTDRGAMRRLKSDRPPRVNLLGRQSSYLSSDRITGV